MSDEELSSETAEETSSEGTEIKTISEINKALKDKFRLTQDEEILKDIKPSIFAFVPMYLIAITIFAVHWLFSVNWTSNDDDNMFVKLMFELVNISKIGEIGVVIIMLGIAWFNQ